MLAACAAESGIDVLIMRLEPIAERSAQHAGIGASRSALQHEMFAVEEIGGIAFVERKRLESGEGREWRGGPFPTVGQHPFEAEGAPCCGKRAYGKGIPARESEVSVLCGG